MEKVRSNYRELVTGSRVNLYLHHELSNEISKDEDKVEVFKAVITTLNDLFKWQQKLLVKYPPITSEVLLFLVLIRNGGWR